MRARRLLALVVTWAATVLGEQQQQQQPLRRRRRRRRNPTAQKWLLRPNHHNTQLTAVNYSSSRNAFFPQTRRHWDVQVEADAQKLVAHYGALVRRFAEELRQEMALADEYAARRECRGVLGKIEAAMLYVLVRMTNPRRVLEVGALCGYSTRWVLAALAKNGQGGHLYSFDLQDVVTKVITDNLDLWSFTQTDVTTLDGRLLTDYDLIFIDALHMNQFAKTYVKKILAPVTRLTPVVVHDVYNPLMMPPYRHCNERSASTTFDAEIACIRAVARNWTAAHRADDLLYGPDQASGEGPELLAWLARTARAGSSVVTFTPYNAPTLAFGLRDVFLDLNVISPDANLNQPAAFFLLRGRGASSDLRQ